MQVVCDALQAHGVEYQVGNAGMHALMPLPDIMDMRVMVEEDDMEAARQVLADMEKGSHA